MNMNMHEVLLRFLKRLGTRASNRTPSNNATKEQTPSVQGLIEKGARPPTALPYETSKPQPEEGNATSTEVYSLIELTPAVLEKHPNREVWSLLTALAHQQKGNIPKAKEFIDLARAWGCDSSVLNRLVLSIAYEGIACLSANAGRPDLAKRQLTHASSLVAAASRNLSSTHPGLIPALGELGLSGTSNASAPPRDPTQKNVGSTGRLTGQKDRTHSLESAPELHTLLSPFRPIEVVDIGANPIDGSPPYIPILNLGICHVTGFEPNDRALAELNLKKGDNEKYFSKAIGDGSPQSINFYRASGMTSLFEIDETKLKLFNFFSTLCEIKSRIPINTHRIDDLEEISSVDYLKIDIQGGELSALKSGEKKIESAIAIQTEVSFITLYKEQPAFGEIDVFLRSKNFVPHCFAAVKHWPITPYARKGAPKTPLNQLLEADIVYIKDISKDELFGDEQLKHLALIAHYCYLSYDLALRCIQILVERGALDSSVASIYREMIASE